VQRRTAAQRLNGVTDTMADPATPEQVYRDNAVALLRLAFLLTNSREHAEDIVQQAFTSAFARWPTIEQPLAYLKRAVVNMANETHRRRARDRGLVERAGAVSEGVTTQPEVDEAWAYIRRLPARQRTVVVLHFYEDLALHQIADLLSRPAATIRSDLRRALNRLRKVLR